MNKNIGDMTNDELIDFIIELQEENSRYERRIDKANWWLEEMLKQAKNDETKAIIYGTLDLLLKEIKNG